VRRINSGQLQEWQLLRLCDSLGEAPEASVSRGRMREGMRLAASVVATTVAYPRLAAPTSVGSGRASISTTPSCPPSSPPNTHTLAVCPVQTTTEASTSCTGQSSLGNGEAAAVASEHPGAGAPAERLRTSEVASSSNNITGVILHAHFLVQYAP
jgi:hypothetical protein